MKITNRRLLEADGAFNALLGTPLDFKVAYRMQKIAQKIGGQMQSVEKDRQGLFDKHGEKQPNGTKKIPDANVDAFKKDWDVILDTEVELDVVAIPYECIEGVKITAYQVAQLSDFIAEPVKK